MRTFEVFKASIMVCCLCFMSSSGLRRSQPKIFVENDHLILESAVDRNISIRLVGESYFMVNDIEILRYIQGVRAQNVLETPEVALALKEQVRSLINHVHGPNGLDEQVRRISNSTSRRPVVGFATIRRRLLALIQQVNELDRKLYENNCTANPCKNGAVCIDLFDNFHCICPKNWQGKTCEIDVDECYDFAGTDLGCQNGVCVNMAGSYECECNSGWKGIHCRQREVDCSTSSLGELCGNGVCVPKNDNFGYTCICNPGWKPNNATRACTVDIDECAQLTHRCVNSCINLPGSYMCGPCPAGYSGNGMTCTDIDECELNNGGCSMAPRVRCINTQGSHHCSNCPLGWSGDGRTCSRDSNSCSTYGICHPQATCNYLSNSIICTCPPGMTGNGYGPAGCVSIGMDPCNPNQCKNGGTCQPHGSSYVCVCPPGFEQPNCEKRDACQLNPCKNEGLCMPTLTGFRCLCKPEFKGTTCDEERTICQSILRESSGTIRYPLNGNTYLPNESCAWVIRTADDKVLNITFSKFDVELYRECLKDFLQIHDGRSAAADLIDRFCGTSLPRGGTIISSHNLLYFWFKSDAAIQKEGFTFTWQSIDPICGGKINFQSHGVIQSPGYPGKSPPNRDCQWTLEAPPDKRILLTFNQVDLTPTQNCSGDYLKIFDGESKTQELHKFCERISPEPIESISNTIVVHFSTDGNNFDSSFQLHFSAIEGIHSCGGLFTTVEGGFESPRIGDFRDTNYTCKYLIRVHPTARVKLDFPEFDLGLFNTGSTRSVQIFDGKSEEDPLIAESCNYIAPENVESSSNYLLVKYHFYGPMMQEKFGFRAHYKIGCGGVFKEYTGTIVSPLYPNKYVSDLHCIYTIEAPEGYVISINLREMDFERDGWELTRCDPGDDNLAIYSPQINNASFMGRYCDITHFLSHTVSKYNRVVLVFRTNSEVNQKGFKIEYKMEEIGCGGVRNDDNGTIHFESDTQISTKTECEWILVAPKNVHIYMQFEKFDIGGSPKCENRFFAIHGDQITPKKHIGTYCGTDSPDAGAYAMHTLKISFYAESLNSGEGFYLNYRFIDMQRECYAEYSTPVGLIHSPGWPGEYFESSNCTWIINAPAGQQIQLTVNTFHLEFNSECELDSLDIRDGRFKDSPQIGIFCGENIPKTLISYTNSLYLHFTSDDALEYPGFEIEWNRASQSCGGTLKSHKGYILAPHYPETVSHGMQCDWRIIVNYGSALKITVTIPHDDNNKCELGFLTIFDGLTNLNNQIKPNCSMNSIRIFETTQNAALVRYRSVSDDANSFQLSYETNCKTTLTDLIGVIESPNFPNTYPSNLKCDWRILGKKGHKISIAFSHVDLEMISSECRYDVLEVLDAQDGVIRETNTICSLPDKVITSSGDTVAVRFTSDYSNGGSGFRLEYEIKGCSNYLTAPGGIISSPNPPYSVDKYCEWTIDAGYGNVVELNIFDMAIKTNNKDCSKNAILISNDKAGNSTLWKVCQSETGNRMVTSSGHMMYIKFYTDSENEQKYIKASYFVKHSICGGRFLVMSGNIHSQNYPQKYPKNMYCEWIISAGHHHTLDMSFNAFNLGNDSNCDESYVELYDGSKKTPDRLLLRHCGPNLPIFKFLQSFQNQVLVIFKSSNDTEPGTGFELHYKRNCGKDILDQPSGYFDKGLNDNNCIWTISSSNSSTHITLQFEHLQCSCPIGNQSDCESQRGIQVFDGDSTQAPLKISFCTHHPHAIISNGQSLTIKATNGEFRAFYSLYENACGGKLTSLRGKFASPRYPNSYPTSVECVWEIKAADGNFIEISIETLKIPKSEHCSEDYVEIRENSGNGKLLGTFCGNEIPPMVVGFEKIWVKFRSDDDLTGDGFLAAWTYAHANEVTGMEGKIKSPPIEGFRNDDESYSWRIIVPRGNVIALTFQEYIFGSLMLYDGLDETALQIDVDKDSGEITSSTNIAYITSENGNIAAFLIKWKAVPKNVSNQILPTDNSTCTNTTLVIPVNEHVNISSPGYPFGYANNIHCEWILKADDPAVHVLIKPYEVDLEPLSECSYDYLKIYSSQDLITWNEEDTFCDKPRQVWPIKFIRGKPFAKLVFHTDTSVNKTGFSVRVTTECGSELTEQEGIIRGIVASTKIGFYTQNCTWSIRVKPGKRIRFTFNSMEVPTSEDPNICDGYVSIKDGFDEGAKYLGIGKYCKGKNLTIPETSTNRAFIRSFVSHVNDMRWELEYKEIGDSCGDIIHLTKERNSTNITTPNYPNVPNPNTECVWIVLAPPGESLELTFTERFDLHPTRYCKYEFVEVRDGATSVSKLIKKFCMKQTLPRPTGNALYIRYVTEMSDPRNGFKAHVTLAKCGGRFTFYRSQIKSENYPAIGGYPSNSVCDYWISLPLNTRVNISFLDIHLPLLANRSDSDHLSFYIVDEAQNNTLLEVAEIYGDNHRPFIEIESNKVLIKFFSYKPNYEYRGFKLAYNYFSGKCGRRVTAESGEINIPNYRTRLVCQWTITVPKGRRVRVDLVQFSPRVGANNTDYTIIFSNDYPRTSVIATVTNLADMRAISSSDNIMFIRLFKRSTSELFSATFEFTSSEISYCLPHISEESGLISAPFTTENYMCKTIVDLNSRQTLSFYIEELRIQNSTKDDVSPLVIRGLNYEIVRSFSENTTNEIVAFAGPSALIQLVQNDKWQIKNLRINYKRMDCGGIFTTQGNSIVSKPNITSDGRIDCAWIFRSRENYNLTGSVYLNQDCNKEFVAVHSGPQLRKICGNSTSFSVNNTVYSYIHYHAEEYHITSGFEIHITPLTNCGGSFSNEFGFLPNIEFTNKDYKNNLECVWEIQNKFGYSTEIVFFKRFYIEESVNCTKDYLQVRVYTDNSWTRYPRLCGRHVPDPINITNSKMQIMFRSDDSNTGDGFSIRLRIHCGGIYTATTTTQSILLSVFDRRPYIQICNFTLITKTDDMIKVTFKDFDLQSSGWCIESRMTILREDRYNENEMVEQGNYCKVDSIKEVRGRHKIIILANMTIGTSLTFEFKLDTCGGSIRNSTVIQSQQHDTEANSFAADMNCVWNVTAPDDYGIVIAFKKFDFQDYSACLDNHVRIYSGTEVSDKNLKRELCGIYKEKKPIVKLQESKAVITAKSGSYGSFGQGFSALIKFTKLCDEEILLTDKNLTYHFDRFNGDYDSYLDCHYIFTAPDGYHLQIDFNNFNLTPCHTGSTECKCDFVEIRDGDANSVDVFGTFCGLDRPPKILSSNRKIFLRFVTDSDRSGRGFDATVKIVRSPCGDTLINVELNKEVVLQSPNYGQLYPASTVCYWTINSSSSIEMQFDKFDLEEPDESGNCRDLLDITFTAAFSGSDQRYHEILCGNKIPHNYYFSSDKNKVQITFKTNAERERTGFKARLREANGCNVTYTGLNGKIKKEVGSAECEIHFDLPQNYTISFYIATYFASYSNCSESYIKFYDETSNELLRTVCSYNNFIFINSNKVRAHLRLQYYPTFEMTYVGSNKGLGCGGQFYQLEGHFSSPLYPSNTGNSTNCRWQIHFPQKYKIKISFEVFDMGSTATCPYNYVKIFEIASGEEKEIRKFCGDVLPAVYTSEHNELAIVYNKTVNFDGTGWVISFGFTNQE